MKNLAPWFAPLLLSSFAHAAQDDLVARMGDVSVNVREARQVLEQAIPENRQALTAEAAERLVRTEAVRRSLAAEARKQGLDKRPEVVAGMARAAEQILVASYMNQIARPPADYPSDAQIKASYEANKASFTLPRRYHLAQIYLSGTDAKSRAKAEALYREVTGKKSADFGTVARRSSEHKVSAAKAGDMGWVAEADLMPDLRGVVEKLAKNGIGKPVAGKEGVHIVKLLERKEAEPVPLADVKATLVREMRLRRAKEIEAAYLEGLLAKTPVAVNGIALEEVVKDVTGR